MLSNFQFDTITIIGVVTIATLVVLISLNAYLRGRKPKENDRRAIEPQFILQLKNAFGFSNIKQITLEHERVKFTVENIKMVDLDALKSLSNKGVFVKGKDITMTFVYDPKIIKNEIEKGV
jgi:phosphotransferase system IIB component